MRSDILKIAYQKFQKLRLEYPGFINVIIDDWRGFRFIYDTVDVRKCNNQCERCPLYLLLKDEKEGIFSAGLYLASKKDKKLFGPQRFLNCKTMKQYENCYLNFLIKEANSRRIIEDELLLIRNLDFIFSKEGKKKELGKKFKQTLIKAGSSLLK